jgi:acetyl-CoA acetyltransferase
MRGALKSAGLKLDDMDIIEINEAFAAQYLSCEKELGLDRSKTNVNGGDYNDMFGDDDHDVLI